MIVRTSKQLMSTNKEQKQQQCATKYMNDQPRNPSIFNPLQHQVNML